MSGAYYAIFVVGILVVIHWYITNERLGQNSGGSKGLLAMRAAPESEADTGRVGRDGQTVGPGTRQAVIESKQNR